MIPRPPNPPVGGIIKEGNIGDCPICNSTTVKKYNFLIFSFGKKIGCINHGCELYINSVDRNRDKKLKKLGIK